MTLAKSDYLNCVNQITAMLVAGQTATVVLSKSCDSDMYKRNNPYYGHLTKVQTYGGWSVGTNYDCSCQNAAKRSGSTQEFESKSVWHIFYNRFFETDKKTQSKYYLQLQKSEKQGSRISSQYYLDGVLISDKELDTIKAQWFKPVVHTQSSSQVAAGISATEERHYNTISLENIVSITQGSTIIELI